MFDVEQLINEVKRRPVLWDISHPEYNHRQSKRSAWEEVAFNMFPDSLEWSNYDKFGKGSMSLKMLTRTLRKWDAESMSQAVMATRDGMPFATAARNFNVPRSTLRRELLKKHYTSEFRKICIKDLQKKWKHVRDNYVRELKYERKVEKGMATAKRKKYMYFHLLDFLVFKKKDTKKGCSDDPSDSELDDSQDQDLGDSSNSISPSMNCSALLGHDYVASKDSQLDKTPTSPKTLQGFSSEQYEGYSDNLISKAEEEVSRITATLPNSVSHIPMENDEDKMFLMSLLPYFKKLSEEKKLQARIGVENLLFTLLYNKG